MLIYRRITAVALAAVVLLTSVGCSKLRELRSATGMGDISQWTAGKMTQAFSAINAKIGADPADYELVLINEYFLRVEAIDPHKRENVDQYTYQGGIVEVKPVDVSRNGPGQVEISAFRSDAVKPEVLARVMSSAPKDSGVAENPAVEWVMVRKVLIPSTYEPPQVLNDNRPDIEVEIKGPRGSKIVHYDLSGGFMNVSTG
jgi:hypothetical protein